MLLYLVENITISKDTAIIRFKILLLLLDYSDIVNDILTDIGLIMIKVQNHAVIKKFTRFAFKCYQSLFLQSIRSASLRLLPIILIGSISLAIDAFLTNIVTFIPHESLHIFLRFLNHYTIGIYGLYLAFSMGISVAEQKGCLHQEQVILGFFSLIAFIIYIKIGQGDLRHVLNDDFSVTHALEAALVGCFTVLFYFFLKRHISKNTTRVDTTYSLFFHDSISRAEIIALIVVMAAGAGIFKYFFITKVQLGHTPAQFIQHFYDTNSRTFFTVLVCSFLDSISWLCGVPYSSTILRYNLIPATNINILLFENGQTVTNPYTSALFSFVMLGGSGQTLSLVIALLLFCKHNGSRSLSKAALIPSLFNINEPLIYGLPIMANPIFIVPFIITPIVSLLITVVCIKVGLMPIPLGYGNWATPALFMGILSTKSIAGGIVQLVNIAVGIAIYRPFIIMHDKYKIYADKKETKHLEQIYKQTEATVTDITLCDLSGTPGVVARFLANDLQSQDVISQLKMLYQPQFDHEMHIFGVEALLRWEHPVFGNLYPPLVFKLAQEAGVLTQIEEAVYLMVQKDIASHPDLKFSINATPLSLRNSQFVEYIKRMYLDALVANPNIYIEVTEQNKLITDETLLENLQQLRRIGFKLAIDDFSMGHTSLRYLQDNKFDLVKLDGNFTKNMIKNPKTQHIIDSIVYLGKTSGFTVLAEYVETEQQKQLLHNLGCTLYQGNLCSYPVSIHRIDSMLQKQATQA